MAFCDENDGFGTVNAFEKCKNHPRHKCAVKKSTPSYKSK